MNTLAMTTQTQLSTKANEKELADGIAKVASCFDLGHSELAKAISAGLPALRPESTGLPLDDSLNKLANRGIIDVHATNFLFKQNRDMQKRLDDLEAKLKKKASKKKLDEKTEDIKDKLSERMETLEGEIQRKMEMLDRKVMTDIKAFEKMLADLETATLWKIRDCEELLKSRVSDTYVSDAIKALHEKLIKEVNLKPSQMDSFSF